MILQEKSLASRSIFLISVAVSISDFFSSSVNDSRYKYDDIWMKTPEYLTHDEALTLKAVVEGKWEACEAYWMDRLLSYGYIKKTETGYKPTIVVFEQGAKELYLNCWKHTAG